VKKHLSLAFICLVAGAAPFVTLADDEANTGFKAKVQHDAKAVSEAVQQGATKAGAAIKRGARKTGDVIKATTHKVGNAAKHSSGKTPAADDQPAAKAGTQTKPQAQ
jgi:hypothetical protein